MDVESFFDSTAFDAENFLPSTLSSNFDDDVGSHPDYLNGGGSYAEADTTFMSPLHLDTPGPDADSLQFRQFSSGGAREASAKPSRREVSASAAQDRNSHSRAYAQQRRNRQHQANSIHHSASPRMQTHSQLFAQHVVQRQHPSAALAPRFGGLSASSESSDLFFDSPSSGNGHGRSRLLPSSSGVSGGAEASLGTASPPGQSYPLDGRSGGGGRRGSASSSDVVRIECKPGKLGISIAYDGESKTAAIDFVQACPWQPDLARKARPGQIIVRIGKWDAVGRSSALITSKLSALQTNGGVLVVCSPDGMSQTDTSSLGSTLPRSVSGSAAAAAAAAATTSSRSTSDTVSEQRRIRQRPTQGAMRVGDLYSSSNAPQGYFTHVHQQLGHSGPRPGASVGGRGLASMLGASGSVRHSGVPPHLYASAQSALNFTISAVVHAPTPAAGENADNDEEVGEKGSKQAAGGKISRKVYNKKRLREISDYIDTLRGVATPYGFRMQCKRDVLRATVSLVNQLQQQNALLHDVLSSIVRPGDPSSLASHAGGLGRSAAFVGAGLVPSSPGEQASTGGKGGGGSQRASAAPPRKSSASRRRGPRAGASKAASTAVTAQGTSSASQKFAKRKKLHVNTSPPPPKKKKPEAEADAKI